MVLNRSRVTLRAKKTKTLGWSLYLDIQNEGRRYFEYLSIYLKDNYPKYYREGKRPRISAEDRELLEIARLKEAEVRRKLLLGTFGFEQARRMDIIDFCKLIVQEKDHRTYDALLKHLENYISRRFNIHELSFDFLHGFQKDLLKQVSANSTKTYMQRFKIIYRVAVKRGYAKGNPFKDLPIIKTTEPKISYLEFSEIQKLANTKEEIGNKVVTSSFLFSCFTGIRFIDLKNIKWNQIQNNELTFKQQKTGRMTKIPLSKAAIKILDEWKLINIDSTTKIFGKLPYNKHSNDLLIRWAKLAGINKKLRFHVGRHTFAIMALKKCKDIFLVSKLLGHANIKSTMVYLKYIDEEGRKAVDLLPELE